MTTSKQPKMKKSASSRSFSRKKFTIVAGSAAIMLSLTVFVSCYMLFSPHKPTNTANIVNKVDYTKNSPKVAVPTESPKPTTPDASEDKQPASKAEISPSTTKTPQASIQPRVNSPSSTAPGPLRVIGFTAGTYTLCSSLVFSYAYINTNVSAAGTIHWQIEQRQGGDISVIGAGDVTLAERTGTYQLGDLEPYKAQLTNEDTAIRLHVTTPNDISSAWYTPDYGFRGCTPSY